MTELTAAFRTVGSSETVRNDRVVPYYLDDRKLRIAIARVDAPPLRVGQPGPADRPQGTMLTLGRPPRRHDDHAPMPRLPVRHHDRSRAEGPATVVLTTYVAHEVDGHVQVRT